MPAESSPSAPVPWCLLHADGCLLRIKVQPKASPTGVAGEVGDQLKVRIGAAAEDGKANAMLLKYLSQALQVSQHALTLRVGERCRNKEVVVTGLPPAEVSRRLSASLPRSKNC